MVNTLIATDDLTVLGGPTSLKVAVDFGPVGQRGSNIFVGTGQPNIPGVVGQTPNVFDLFINLLTSDEEYLYMYQYQSVDGSNIWVRLLKLIPNLYNKNSLQTFTAGVAEFNIPVLDIVPLTMTSNLTPENFNIQYSIPGLNPIASALDVEPDLVIVGDQLILQFRITASELISTTWTPLATSKTVQLSITVV